MPILSNRWAEHFAEKARGEFVKKTLKVNGQDILTGDNIGLQLGQEPVSVIKCPLQRNATQVRYIGSLY